VRVLKSFVFFLVLAFVFSACGGSEEVGKMPSFRIRDLNGGYITNKDLEGSVSVIEFWATWCMPCLSEIPAFNELQRQYGDRKLVVLGMAVKSGAEPVLKEFVRSHNMTYKIGIATYKTEWDFGGVKAVPTTFLFDKQGNLRKVFVGAHPAKIQELRKEVEKLL
jgi:thiol-disulfide isomerase/thioredoxin